MVDRVSTVVGLPGQPQPEEEELEQAATVTQPIATTAVPITGGIPTPAVGGGISAAAPREAGFVSAQRLVAANLPQTRQLAERVGQQLEQRAQETRGAITQAGQAFQQQVTAGLPGSFQPEASEAFISRALTAPTTLSEQERQQFQTLTTGAFGGPQTFEAGEQFIPLSQQVTEAQRQAGLAGTSIGRRELLLGDQSGRVRSRGVRALNELLLGATPEASQRLQQAAGQFTDIPQLLQQTAEAGTAFSLQQQEALSAFQQQALEQLGGAREAVTTGIEERVGELRSEAERRGAGARQALQAGIPLSDQQIQDLGLTRDQAEQLQIQLGQARSLQGLTGGLTGLGGREFQITAEPVDILTRLPGIFGRKQTDITDIAQITPEAFGIDPTQALTLLSPEVQITPQTVATQENIARLEALRQLGGLEEIPQFLTDPSLLGTATGDIVEFAADPVFEQLSGLLGGEAAQNVLSRARQELDILSREQKLLQDGGATILRGPTNQPFFQPLSDEQKIQLQQSIQQRSTALTGLQQFGFEIEGAPTVISAPPPIPTVTPFPGLGG